MVEAVRGNSSYGWTVQYALSYDDYYASPTATLREELSKFGGTPPEDNKKQWFEKWLAGLPEEKETGPGGMDMETIQNMMGKGGGAGGAKGAGKGKGYSENQNSEEGEKEEDGYTWSQKGEEVQIAFNLSKAASKKDVGSPGAPGKRAKKQMENFEVKVVFKQTSITVQANGQTLLDGALNGKVETEDCTRCLVNGGTELNVMLTKQNESDKWTALLK